MKHLQYGKKYRAQEYKKKTNFYANVLKLGKALKEKKTADVNVLAYNEADKVLTTLAHGYQGKASASTDAYTKLFDALVDWSNTNNGTTAEQSAYLADFLIQAIRPGGGLDTCSLVLPEDSVLQNNPPGFKDRTEFQDKLEVMFSNIKVAITAVQPGVMTEADKKALGDNLNKVTARDKNKIKQAAVADLAALGAPPAAPTGIGLSNSTPPPTVPLTPAEQKLQDNLKLVTGVDTSHLDLQSNIVGWMKGDSVNALKAWQKDGTKVTSADEMDIVYDDADGNNQKKKLKDLKASVDPFEKALGDKIEQELQAVVDPDRSKRITKEIDNLNASGGAIDLAQKSIDEAVAALKVPNGELSAVAADYSGAVDSNVNKAVFKAVAEFVTDVTSGSSSSSSSPPDYAQHVIDALAQTDAAGDTYETRIEERVKKKYGNADSTVAREQAAYYADASTRAYETNRLTRLKQAKTEGLANDAVAIPVNFVSSVSGGSPLVYDAAQDRVLINAHLNLNGETFKDAAGKVIAPKPTVELDEGFLVDEQTNGKIEENPAVLKEKLNVMLIGASHATLVTVATGHDDGKGALAMFLAANVSKYPSLKAGMQFVCRPHTAADGVQVFIEIKDATAPGGLRQPNSPTTSAADAQDPAKSEKAALAALSTEFLESQVKLNVRATSESAKSLTASAITLKYSAAP